MSIHSIVSMAKSIAKGRFTSTEFKMTYHVYYLTRWMNLPKFCGVFNTIHSANDHINFLQNKLPNGKKITFKIVG